MSSGFWHSNLPIALIVLGAVLIFVVPEIFKHSK